MKYMFVSDIHGNTAKMEEIIEIFKKENIDKLVILGDTASSYDEFDTQYIVDILNHMSNKVEVIRGNCDTYDFEKCLDFAIYDLDNLYINGRVVTITHGHHYNSLDLPPNCGEIFIQGHTHVPILKKEKGRIFANPGSISRPRGVDLKCYIIIDEKQILLKTLEGIVINTIVLN
ncbi:MAG: YfcE family phosphodiesterase [Clostridia bacterium]|nr:YfcE family phosphodiesterase [Clostridia bacterium]